VSGSASGDVASRPSRPLLTTSAAGSGPACGWSGQTALGRIAGRLSWERPSSEARLTFLSLERRWSPGQVVRPKVVAMAAEHEAPTGQDVAPGRCTQSNFRQARVFATLGPRRDGPCVAGPGGSLVRLRLTKDKNPSLSGYFGTFFVALRVWLRNTSRPDRVTGRRRTK
jgi:hypothetical protein